VSAPIVSRPPVTMPPALTPERPVAWPKRTVRTLANGLQVVLAESRNFPKISAQLFFRSGNSLVALSKPGLADMTAGVVRAGTASRTSRQIEEDLRRMGAGLGSHSGADTSAISAAGLAEFSGGILELIADLARNASFPEDEFERERRQRFEEVRVERTTPGFLANERLRAELFGRHPYSVAAPLPEQVAAYERADLQEFYRQHYVPSGSLLIVVGDFAAEEMLERIEKIFGDWKAPEAAVPEWPAPLHSHGRRVHLVHLPGAVQTQVLLGNLGITRRDAGWFELVLANAIYGGAFHSRLVMNIREQKGYTYSPRSSLHSLRQYGYFSVHAAVRNEVAAATLTEMFYELDRMRSLPVTPEELESAQSYLTGVFSLGVATQDGVLGQLSTIYLDRLAADYLETYRERVRRLTADNVMEAARAHFDSANAQIVLVGDRHAIARQAVLFGEVTEYNAPG
jgi:zinc protease